MLVGYTASDYQNWTNEIHGYEKEKRTKKPFGKQFSPSASHVKIQEVRQKQRQFNPVLQKYNNQKQQKKEISKEQSSRIVSLDHYYRTVGRNNQRKYDIINLHGVDNINENQKNFKVRNPIRNLYNPINNQPIPQNFYRNREVRLSPEKTFKNIKPEGREFDIVTGIYHYDHQQKKYQQIEQKNRKIKQKYDKTHDYNSVMGRYYDQQKQIEYENMLATSQQKQSMGDEYNKRFPAGYINRQPLILDQTKPLTQSLIALDNKREKAKQRYKLKYLIEKQYQKRNMEHQQNQQRKLINRVHNSHSMDNKAKQFYLSQLPLMENQILLGRDRRIIQNNQNPQISSGSLSSRQSYNQSQKSSSMSNRSYLIRGRIKSGGFF